MGRHPVFSHGAGLDGVSSTTSSYDRTRTSTRMRSLASTRAGNNRRTRGFAATAKSCRSNGLYILRFIINNITPFPFMVPESQSPFNRFPFPARPRSLSTFPRDQTWSAGLGIMRQTPACWAGKYEMKLKIFGPVGRL